MSSFSFTNLLRPHLQKLRPYSSARHEFSGNASVFLDANENPFDTGFNRYPDPSAIVLRRMLADIKKVSADKIFIGNGSDEPIDLLIRAFCQPGIDNIVITNPTYGMYSVSASINNVGIVKVPLQSDFSLDPDSLLASVNAETRMIFLCSPNNPTGNAIGSQNIRKILKGFQGIVVVDEAYIDFCPEESMTNELNSFPNLVILQTLSKAWGLAGLRLGLCISHPELVRILDAIKPPYNISSATQAAAGEILKAGTGKRDAAVAEILAQRKWLRDEFEKLGLRVFPSDANFLLVRFTDPKRIMHALRESGIIVRDRSGEHGCAGCLRITVGTPAENRQLIEKLKQLIQA